MTELSIDITTATWSGKARSGACPHALGAWYLRGSHDVSALGHSTHALHWKRVPEGVSADGGLHGAELARHVAVRYDAVVLA